MKYAHTPEGRLTRHVYPDATMVCYEYNIRGKLARVIDKCNDGKPFLFDYTRRADGKITAIDLPNGAKTTKTYDEVGRLKTVAHLDKGGKILESETSRYDLRNRRTARIKADGSTDLFRYDPAGQVTAAAYGQANVAAASGEPPPPGVDANSTSGRDEPGSSTFTPSQTFAYDAAGNRLEVTDNGMTTKYQPNAANQYEQIVTGTEIVEPQFDPLGNLLKDDRNTYTWDSDIHLLSVSTMSKERPGTKNPEQRTEFRYDPLHRRVARLEKQSELTLFTHDGWNVIQEHSGNLKLKTSNLKRSARHTWGEDLSGTLQGAGGVGGLLGTIHNVAKTKTQEQEIASWFHYDSNGNVILLTDGAGDASARYAYDAFGQTLTGTGIAADLNCYRFSTKPIESGSGLAYYGYRYYDPVSGRWPSRDPRNEYTFDTRRARKLHSFFISWGNEKISSQDYDFATNAPVDAIDKMGLSPLGAVIAGVGGGAVCVGYMFYCASESSEAYTDATSWSESLTGTSSLDPGSAADALRHCVGACESVRIPGCVDAVMENRIQAREDSATDAGRIDYVNNEAGFAAGHGTQDCQDSCLWAYLSGDLESDYTE